MTEPPPTDMNRNALQHHQQQHSNPKHKSSRLSGWELRALLGPARSPASLASLGSARLGSPRLLASLASLASLRLASLACLARLARLPGRAMIQKAQEQYKYPVLHIRTRT